VGRVAGVPGGRSAHPGGSSGGDAYGRVDAAYVLFSLDAVGRAAAVERRAGRSRRFRRRVPHPCRGLNCMGALFMSLELNAAQLQLILVRSRLATGPGAYRKRTSVTPAAPAPGRIAGMPSSRCCQGAPAIYSPALARGRVIADRCTP